MLSRFCGEVVPIPTPVALARMTSLPPSAIATVSMAGENKPVVTSPLREGLVVEAEVPRLTPEVLPAEVRIVSHAPLM